jgi:hypothetical protein
LACPKSWVPIGFSAFKDAILHKIKRVYESSYIVVLLMHFVNTTDMLFIGV